MSLSATSSETATPNLENKGDEEGQIVVEEEEEENNGKSWFDAAIMGLTFFTTTASVGAVAFAASPLVIVASISGAVIAPYTYYQHHGLTATNNLMKTYNRFQLEVDFMLAENDRLEETMKVFDATLQRLEDVETAFNALNQNAGQSVEDFREEVAKNKRILADMKVNLKANVRQNLLSVLIRSDVDGDGKIDSKEIETLIKRMESVNGLKINADAFRIAIVSSGGSLRSIMDHVKKMLADDFTDKNSNAIFQVSN